MVVIDSLLDAFGIKWLKYTFDFIKYCFHALTSVLPLNFGVILKEDL